MACREFGSGRFLLHYADGTRFHVDAPGRAIFATWPADLTLEDTATYLLGPVLGFYLRLLGHVCLHASAVIIGGRSVAFVGPAGSGKSTLAAGFAALGETVLTEDVACLDGRDGAFGVRPGYPRIRLWDGSARLLPGAAAGLPRLTPNWDKRYLALGDSEHPFGTEPTRLGAVFLLGERRPMAEPAAIHTLPGQDVLTRLVANTYGNYLLDPRLRAAEFDIVGRLAQSVPVRALALTDDGSRLLEACNWIRRHALDG